MDIAEGHLKREATENRHRVTVLNNCVAKDVRPTRFWGRRLKIDQLAMDPVYRIPMNHYYPGARGTKQTLSIRIIDILISIPLLICVFPVMMMIALVVLLFDGRPVLFCQTRYGLGMQEITLLKFRTMRVLAKTLGQEILRHLK